MNAVINFELFGFALTFNLIAFGVFTALNLANLVWGDHFTSLATFTWIKVAKVRLYATLASAILLTVLGIACIVLFPLESVASVMVVVPTALSVFFEWRRALKAQLAA